MTDAQLDARQHPERCLTTTVTTTTAPPAAGPQRFGFSESQHFVAERAAGASFVRFSVDTVNDAQFENQYTHATLAGLAVIAVVHANTSTGASVYAGRAQWVAQNFPGIKLELGNEWNIQGFTPAQAASYQIAGYNAAKAASPSSVVSCGLAPYGTLGSGIQNPVRFLEGMYANGLAGHFDELGWHPYNFGDNYTAAQMLSTSDPWSAWAQMAWTVPSARSLMVQYGDEAKPITATEWGAPTDDPAGGYTGGVSLTEQENLMSQGIAAWKSYAWAGDLTVYEYDDLCVGSSRECHFGLVDRDGIPKPALAAFTAAVQP
jgi:hypothetical protein